MIELTEEENFRHKNINALYAKRNFLKILKIIILK